MVKTTDWGDVPASCLPPGTNVHSASGVGSDPPGNSLYRNSYPNYNARHLCGSIWEWARGYERWREQRIPGRPNRTAEKHSERRSCPKSLLKNAMNRLLKKVQMLGATTQMRLVQQPAREEEVVAPETTNGASLRADVLPCVALNRRNLQHPAGHVRCKNRDQRCRDLGARGALILARHRFVKLDPAGLDLRLSGIAQQTRWHQPRVAEIVGSPQRG